jgi:ABC-type glycerol-3-phosphate transport system substrate-binding protein
MRRKTLVGLTLITIAALLLAACGKDQEEAPPPTATAVPETQEIDEERTTILFAVEDVEKSLYEDMIEAFEEANPDIHVQLASINELLGLGLLGGEPPEDTWQRLASGADVINLSAGMEPVRQGLIRDLKPLMQSDPNFQRSDFLPGTLERGEWDGGTWSLPMRVMYDVIFYDKDAFDEAGVTYPEVGWNWDDFLATAEALTEREGGKVTRWGFVQPDYRHLSFIEGRVGPVIDAKSDPPKPNLDRADVVDAVSWYVDLYLKEEVTPFFEASEGDAASPVSEGRALVENGETPMWNEWSAVWGLRKQQGNRGVVSFPVDGPDSRTSLVYSIGLSMSAGTAHPEEAWRWMDYVSRQDTSEQGPFVRFVPARRSTAEAIGFWEGLDEEMADALRFAIDHDYYTEYTDGYGAFLDALNLALSGEKSVEDAMLEAQAQAEADIQEASADRAEATPVPTVVVSGAGGAESNAGDVTNISFSPGIGAVTNLQAFRDAAEAFNDSQTDIHVDVDLPEFTASIGVPSLAESFDCFQWVSDIQNPQSQAVILNLKPFLDADSSFDIDDFFPALVDQFTWQGQLWGLPAELQPYIIEYNKDIFDAARVEEPDLDWTTDDFVDVATALTTGEGDEKQYGFVPQYYEATDLLPLLQRRGAEFIDETADPPAFTFDNPANAEALRWYANLSTEYDVKPVFLADVADYAEANSYVLEREALITGGRAAMWTSDIVSIFGDRSELNTGVAPMPVGIDGSGGGGSSYGYFISADTEARQACWEFITFLTEQPAVTQGLPARRSVAQSDAYRQQVGPERADVFLASATGSGDFSGDVFEGKSWMSTAGSFWLGRAYDQVVKGEASAEDALRAAQKMADDYRACVVVNDVLADQEGWQDCMLEVDSSIPAILFSQ